MSKASRNVELKARDPDPVKSRSICEQIGAEDHGGLWQRDTYFVVPEGRLKLREQQPGQAQLIHYHRDDWPHQRESRYRIALVADPEAMLAILEATLPIRTVVTKRRRLFIWHSVRIHLDDVDQLGHFIELEAVAPTDSDLERERDLVDQLRERLQITDDRLVPTGYADQLRDLTVPNCR